MNDEERSFEKRKNNLIQKLMHEIFEEDCLNYMRSNEWSSAEELDNWIEEHLKVHDEACENVKKYYDLKIYE